VREETSVSFLKKRNKRLLLNGGWGKRGAKAPIELHFSSFDLSKFEKSPSQPITFTNKNTHKKFTPSAIACVPPARPCERSEVIQGSSSGLDNDGLLIYALGNLKTSTLASVPINTRDA
jgi:hypothetical protein